MNSNLSGLVSLKLSVICGDWSSLKLLVNSNLWGLVFPEALGKGSKIIW